MDRAVVGVGLARITVLERERVAVTGLQGGGVEVFSVRRGDGMRRLPVVDPRNRRPRSNGDLVGIERKILDRDRHLILRRGGGSGDQNGYHDQRHYDWHKETS